MGGPADAPRRVIDLPGGPFVHNVDPRAVFRCCTPAHAHPVGDLRENGIIVAVRLTFSQEDAPQTFATVVPACFQPHSGSTRRNGHFCRGSTGRRGGLTPNPHGRVDEVAWPPWLQPTVLPSSRRPTVSRPAPRDAGGRRCGWPWPGCSWPSIVVVLAGQMAARRGRCSAGSRSRSCLAAWALVLGGIYATFRSWRAVLADLGATLPHGGAMRVFYLGQLGKYLPGTVWPAVTQMRLGRDYRVPPRASGAAVVVFMLHRSRHRAAGRDPGASRCWAATRSPSTAGWCWSCPCCCSALTPPVLNRVIAGGPAG